MSRRLLSPRGEKEETRNKTDLNTQDEMEDDSKANRTSDELAVEKTKSKEKKTRRPFLAPKGVLNIFKPQSVVNIPMPDKEETLLFNVEQVNHRLIQLDIDSHTVSDEHIKAILSTIHADGNPMRAANFIDIEQKAAAGLIAKYDPAVHMQGAVNLEGVSCYLDSLLFSMFASLDTFECLLRADYPEDEHKTKLVNLLRIWVTMLRTGQRIEVDLTGIVLKALQDCGWYGRLDQQQDVSEVFCFITDLLDLPLFASRVTLAHEGKDDESDNKIVKERTFDLAVPDVPYGTVVRLEECFTDYLSTNVDVSRDPTKARLFWEERARAARQDEDTSHTESEDEADSKAGPRDVVKEEDAAASNDTSDATNSPITPKTTPPTSVDAGDSSMDEMALEDDKANLHVGHSLEPPVDAESSASVTPHAEVAEPANPVMDGKKEESSGKPKETMMARQFQRLLLPSVPESIKNAQELTPLQESILKYHKTPIVGMCLKRYAMDKRGNSIKRKTQIDIPERFTIPASLIAVWDEETEDDTTRAESDHRAILQSVICHRGEALQSGHYVTYTRVADRALTENRRHNFDPPPDYQEAQWVLFDDSDNEGRVRRVEDLPKALENETPYMVFYEIVPEYPDVMPIKDSNQDQEQMKPPTYDEARISQDGRRPNDRVLWEYKDDYLHRGRQSTDLPRPDSRGRSGARALQEPGSPRDTTFLSPQKGANGPANVGLSTADNSRKASPNLTPYITPDFPDATAETTPGVSPGLEEPTNMNLNSMQKASRVPSRSFFQMGTLRRGSRPVSQSGENRKGMDSEAGPSLSKRFSTMLRGNKDHSDDPRITTNPTTTANSGAVTPAAGLDAYATSDAETLTALLNHHKSVTENAADQEAHVEHVDDDSPAAAAAERVSLPSQSGDEKLARDLAEVEKTEAEGLGKKKHKGKKSKEDGEKKKGKGKDNDDRECVVM